MGPHRDGHRGGHSRARLIAALPLDKDDLRAVAAYAAECAHTVLDVFEQAQPADARPREAVAAARLFAGGRERGKYLRDAAWAALRASQEATYLAAREAARAAMAAAGAAYLHPLFAADQVKHILGAAAHAAHAAELAAGDGASAGVVSLEGSRRRATAEVIDVLRRYPVAPRGGGRVGELMRELDRALRGA